MASHYHNAAMAWRAYGKIDKALKYLEYSSIIDCQTDREFHPAHAVHMCSMGICIFDQGNVTKANASLVTSLKIRSNVFGAQSADAAICIRNLGAIYNFAGSSMHATKCIQQALDIFQEIYEYEQTFPEIADCMECLGESMGRSQNS